MLAHALCERTKADTSKVINGEADVAGIVLGKEAFERRPEHLVRHPLLNLGHANLLDYGLKQNLDKDAAARRRLVLV